MTEVICIQPNLVNSKSLVFRVLFQIIYSSHYREVDIQIYKTQNNNYPSNISLGA